MKLHGFFALALAWGLATGTVAADAQTGSGQSDACASAFDDFDTLDRERWRVSDGWTNGAYHGCIWSADQAVVRDGTLRLGLEERPEATTASGETRDYVCAEIQSKRRFGYGLYEARMKTAAGSGLNSAFFTYIGPVHGEAHDEIDFEFLGKSPESVQLNYYVDGEGGNEKHVALPQNASEDFAHYAFEWLPDRLRWFVNGELVHEVQGGELPDTPSYAYFMLWNGSPQLKEWLGQFDYSGPVVAEIDWFGYTPPGERCAFEQSMTCGDAAEVGGARTELSCRP